MPVCGAGIASFVTPCRVLSQITRNHGISAQLHSARILHDWRFFPRRWPLFFGGMKCRAVFIKCHWMCCRFSRAMKPKRVVGILFLHGARPSAKYVDALLYEFEWLFLNVSLLLSSTTQKGLKTPPPQALNRISMLFAKLQEAELPFEKLDFLLTAMTVILDNTIDPECEANDVRHFGCDDFLPLLAYVLCKCGFHFAEIEAEYIWGLMMPTVMNGQAGYYTTSLCSAAISLKEFKQQFEAPKGTLVVSEAFNSLDSGCPASVWGFLLFSIFLLLFSSSINFYD